MAASHEGESRCGESHAALLTGLRAVVGAEYAREAGEQDRIDGVPARFVATPGTVEQAAAVMKRAYQADLAVSPVGGGSKLTWGNRPKRVDVILSVERLNRMLEHAAGDLVMRAEAGASLAEVEQALARAGQRLALDPPEPGATLGGIVATNASGPLRHRFGTARDLLIGITYILPDGTVARAGGKVVKNVAGYDLCKLFTGSLGTLGLVAETIFRLHPLPAARRMVIVRGFSRPEELGAAIQSVLHSALVPNALEFEWGETGELQVLFEGFEPGVASQVESATSLLSGHGEFCVEDDIAGGAGKDGTVSPEQAQDWTGLKIGAPIGSLPGVIAAVQSLTDLVILGRDGGCPIRGHAGAGITQVELAGDTESMVAGIERLRDAIGKMEGSVVVQHAPGPVKDALDVWGPIDDALPLMQRVKQMFDPTSIMNAGRFVGGF